MRRAFATSFLLLALLASLVAVVPASAQIEVRFDRSALAGNAYVDTLTWHTGRSHAKTCTLKATEKDTSQRFPLEGIEVFSSAWKHNVIQGTAGGTHTLNCSLQVSIDGTNWMTLTGIPVYSVSTSATGTITENYMQVYTAPGDTAVTATNVSGALGKMYVQGSKWGRFVVAQASGTLDTTFFQGQAFRIYKLR